MSKLFILRPVFASMVSLAIILFGLVALDRLPVREFPDVDPPLVSVTTIYPGASAEVVETEVSERLEEVVNGIEGIKRITSESREQVSTVTVEFSLSRDIDIATQDVRDRVARIREQLPDDVEEPIIAKQDADANPMLWIAVYGEGYSTLELSTFADSVLKDPLQTVEGVSSVILGGEKRFAVRLRLNSRQMAARNITVQDVEEALRERNVELPSGLLENRDREFTIQFDGSFASATDFNNLVIKDEGISLVRLSDIGRAEVGVEDERTVARYNSEPAVGLGVIKQAKANTISVAKGIKAEVERLRPYLPQGVKTLVAYDESIYIERSIEEVWITLGIAFLFVVVSIYLFLGDWRATLVPSLAIPVSVVGTFTFLALFGYSVNILTMLALILAIGIIVDDAIVVLENIYRYVEDGLSPRDAAIRGIKEVQFAVIATTLSLVAVLLPVVVQTSVVGRLLQEFALALGASVVVSTFVALSLTPAAAALLLRKKEGEHQVSFLPRLVSRWVERRRSSYDRVLKGVVSRPLFVVGTGIVSFAVGVACYLALPQEFLPYEDKGSFLAFAFGPEGSTSEYTDRMVRKMEEIVKVQPSLKGYFTAVALARGAPGQANQGIMFARFEEGRESSVNDIVNGPGGVAGRFFAEVEGAFAVAILPKAIGRSFGQPFQLVVQHPDLRELDRITQAVTQKIRQAGVLANVRSTFSLDKPEVKMSVDRDRAAAVGVSPRSVSRTLQVLFGGEALSTIKRGGEEFDVIAQLERERRLVPGDFSHVYVRGVDDRLIPLDNIISYQVSAGPNSVQRVDRLRSATIEGTPAGVSLGAAMDSVEDILDEELPERARYTWAGESEDLLEVSGEGTYALILALILVYMVLASQFESLRHPITVMVAFPLATSGAFSLLLLLGFVDSLGNLFFYASSGPDAPAWAWWGSLIVPRIPSMSINLFSQIGLILLLGLVTKNSILIVEFANQLRAQGMAVKEAVIEAAKIRFRPIVMTSFSTLSGILPIAIGFGAGADSRRPLGVVILGGMVTGTLLTLLVVPALYFLLSRKER